MRLRFMLFLMALLTIAASASLAQDSHASRQVRKVVFKVAPAYPDLARQNKISGAVKVRATIAPNGSVRLVEPAGGNPVLLQACSRSCSELEVRPWSG